MAEKRVGARKITVTSAFATRPSVAVEVIVARPAFTAVMTPEELTVATASLLDVHDAGVVGVTVYPSMLVIGDVTIRAASARVMPTSSALVSGQMLNSSA